MVTLVFIKITVLHKESESRHQVETHMKNAGPQAWLHHFVDQLSKCFELCPFAATKFLEFLFIFLCTWFGLLFIAYIMYQELFFFIYLWCLYFPFSLVSFPAFMINLLCCFCDKKWEIIEYLIHLNMEIGEA